MAVTDSGRIDAALEFILDWGGVDGAHHKQWVLDQVVRTLTGCPTETVTRTDIEGKEFSYTVLGENSKYRAWCEKYEGDPEDDDLYYGEWDTGIAP